MTAGADAVIVERRVEASPETVFRFFTEPARWLRWQGVEAQLDPRRLVALPGPARDHHRRRRCRPRPVATRLMGTQDPMAATERRAEHAS